VYKRQRRPFADKQAQDIPPLRAERHPYAYLLAPLADKKGDDAVDADAREQQRQRRKGRENDRGKPLARDGGGNDLLHGLGTVDDLLAVHVPQRAPDGIKGGRGRSRGARDHLHAGRRCV